MKTLLTLIGLALLGVGITHGQTTNGITAVQAPTATTVVNYKAGVYTLNSAQTTAFTATYLAPAITAMGVTLPSGAVVRTFSVIYYSDGTSRVTISPSGSSNLPAPPAGQP
jgi:hypothetical protein